MVGGVWQKVHSTFIGSSWHPMQPAVEFVAWTITNPSCPLILGFPGAVGEGKNMRAVAMAKTSAPINANLLTFLRILKPLSILPYGNFLFLGTCQGHDSR